MTNDGSGNLSWALPGGGGSTFGNITVAVVDDNTISTTTGNLFLTSATGVVEITNSLNVDSGTLFVDPTNNRVGINTMAPIHELTVNAGGDGYCQIGMENTERTWLVTNNDGDDLVSYSVVIPSPPSVVNRFQFDTVGGNQWFNTGNLGVNNNNPTATLDVTGDGKFSLDLAVNGGDITTTSATASLFDTGATAINIGRMTGSAFSGSNVINIGTSGITYATEFGGLITQNSYTTQAASRFANQTSTSPILIMSTTRKSMKGFITVTDDVTGAIQTLDFLAMRKTSTAEAWITIYAEMISDASLATFTVSDDGTSLNLYANKANSNSTDIAIMRHSLAN